MLFTGCHMSTYISDINAKEEIKFGGSKTTNI